MPFLTNLFPLSPEKKLMKKFVDSYFENFVKTCREFNISLKCAQTFSSNDDLLSHLQFVHGENVKCNKCEFKAYPRYGSSDTFTNLEF